MNRLAKILYGLNSITFVLIGVVHLIVHYQELITPEIEAMLHQTIPLEGQGDVSVWQLWQGFSFTMGVFMIFYGLSHLLILRRLDKAAYPPITASIMMILVLLIIVYAGLQFFGNMQVYGGAWGIAVQSLCLGLSWLAK